MTQEEIKKFLRIDDPDEDISLLMEAGEAYIVDAIGKYDDSNSRHKLLLCNIISSLDNKRSYTDANADKVQYTIHNMVLQLQLEEAENGGASSG